jgi:hypothetical protein
MERFKKLCERVLRHQSDKDNLLRRILLRLWPWLVIFAATLLVSRGWWNSYLLAGHSAYMDFFRQLVLDETVKQGQWWPRFAEAFYTGYGSPLFHFYAPLSYWISELFMLAGASVPVALKCTMGLTLFLSGLFLGLLAGELFGRYAAAAAGTLYVLAPYHLTDILVRHALGESVAFAWLPLALWGILGAVRDQSVWRMLAGSVGMAFLLLTHNITAMIAAPLLMAWWLYWTIHYRHQGWRGPFLGASAAICGLLLSAFFWLPAFAEVDLVWSKRSLTDGYYVFSKHFVYLRQFFSTFWSHGSSCKGGRDSMSFQLGLAHWFSLLLTIPVFIRHKQWRGIIIFLWLALLIALAMCHFISQPLWNHLTLLTFVQFPWRFLLLAALAASLLVSPAAEWLAGLRSRHYHYGRILAILFIILPFLTYAPLTYSKYMLYDAKKKSYRHFFKKDLRQELKKKRYQRLERYFNRRSIRSISIKATSRDDFLPKNVLKTPRKPASTALTLLKSGYILQERRLGPCHYEGVVRSSVENVLHLNRFWYPGWQVSVDGVEQPAYADGKYGLAAVCLNPGEHRVEWYFGTTPLRTRAWQISLLGLLLTGVVMLLFGRPGKKSISSPPRERAFTEE